MKKILTACALFVYASFAKAYDIEATVYVDGETKWYFDIELANNNQDFSAFQFDITLDGIGALEKENLSASKLLSNHNLMLATPNGHYRVIAYSANGSKLKNKEGRLFSFTLDGDFTGITINNIIFAKPDGTEVEADVYTRPLNRSDEDAIKDVKQEPSKVIYDMAGKQVYKIDRQGIYIQNGKKLTR